MTTLKDNAALIALGAELAECEAKKTATPVDDDEQYARLYDLHWALRERINRIAADTLEGLRVKARAAEFALKWDGAVENDGDGSFVGLCRSINADILVLPADACA